MEHDYNELRGLIRAKLGTEQAFADAIGRSNAFISLALNNKTAFGMKDISKACSVLGIAKDDVGRIFFTPQVTDCVTEEKEV